MTNHKKTGGYEILPKFTAMSRIVVHETNDYDKFTPIEGNRILKDGRVNKIISSIEDVGYIPSPILVNEHYQVIDGQGRLEALKRLNMPVYFIVIEGIGIEECISMNINQGNWKLPDYIDSYASRGYRSYLYLQSLLENYGKTFKRVVIFFAAGCGQNPTGLIKKGKINISEEDFNKARYALSWLVGFKSIIDAIEGRNEYFYEALLYCYKETWIDNNKLLDKIKKYQYKLSVVGNIYQAMKQIEDIYNFRSRDTVYIETSYKIDMNEKKKEIARTNGSRRATA